jgi:mannose-1-phosphate guanylyltransferase
MARRATSAPLHVVLLAGGSGTRFWPLSRERRPKQLLALAGPEPLLTAAWKRARRLAPVSRIWVAAPRRLVSPVRRLLPALRQDRLIVEPSPRDTAPAISLACATVAGLDPEAVVGIFPTDQVVRDLDAYVAAVRVAARSAQSGRLVCLGIRPDRPATGFGYLRCARKPLRGRATAVARFVEKPDEATARRFVRSGRYLWNGGMFLWRARRFLDEAGRTAPEVLDPVLRHLAGKRGAWARARRVSVDYAVMERAKDVVVVPLDAGWDDVGSWDAAARWRGPTSPDEGPRILLDSPGAAVFGGDRLVAVVGVAGVVVVDTPDALLVVGRGGSEKVRRVVEQLKAGRLEKLL